MTKYFIVAILVIYFLFTSGFVFEVTQSNATDKIDIPYNTALSSERTGIVASFTDCDVKCAEWIRDNTKDESVAGDVNSSILLMSYISDGRIRTDIYATVYDYENLPDNCYIMILDWNYRHNMGVRVTGMGTRMTFPIPELNYPEVFKCGNSRILKK